MPLPTATPSTPTLHPWQPCYTQWAVLNMSRQDLPPCCTSSTLSPGQASLRQVPRQHAAWLATQGSRMPVGTAAGRVSVPSNLLSGPAGQSCGRAQQQPADYPAPGVRHDASTSQQQQLPQQGQATWQGHHDVQAGCMALRQQQHMPQGCGGHYLPDVGHPGAAPLVPRGPTPAWCWPLAPPAADGSSTGDVSCGAQHSSELPALMSADWYAACEHQKHMLLLPWLSPLLCFTSRCTCRLLLVRPCA